MKIEDKNGNMSYEFYFFLRYNQIRENIDLTNVNKNLYNEFNSLYKKIKKDLASNNSHLPKNFGKLCSMIGLNRRFDSLSGLPIIGKFYKIGDKILSEDSYESLKILKQMEDYNGKN